MKQILCLAFSILLASSSVTCLSVYQVNDGAFGSEVALDGRASIESGVAPRERREVLEMLPVPMAQQSQQAPGMLTSMLSSLGPQTESQPAKALSSLISSFSSSQQQQQQPPPPTQTLVTQLAQLGELVRGTQERNAKMVENAQASVQQAGQQSAQAASNVQGGIQSALTEIGQGLQRIATNNPSLIPDVKNLYQSVSSKLSSASSSAAQAATPMSSNITPAKNSEQLADNLAKLAIPGLQTPA